MTVTPVTPKGGQIAKLLTQELIPRFGPLYCSRDPDRSFRELSFVRKVTLLGFHSTHQIPFPHDHVWEWHTRPGALTRLTPSFFPITAIKEATDLQQGTTVFYLPAGLKWEARYDLSGYYAGQQFTDVCVTAPVKVFTGWRHKHIIKAAGDDATVVDDTITSRAPSSTLASVIAYRQHQLLGDLTRIAEYERDFPTEPLTIAITGSRGLVGQALSAQLSSAGHTVIGLVRENPKGAQRLWDPLNPSAEMLSGVDVVVHLAGEPIFGRFNDEHKQDIYDSRVAPTRALAELTAKLGIKLVSASAIGFYGPALTESVTEDSPCGTGFLADTVKDWEAAAAINPNSAMIRTGIVIAGRGGVLPIFRVLFSAALGGSLGDGSAMMSWISIDDLCDIYFRAIVSDLTGPINATAPEAVSNKEFAQAMSKVMKRPAFLPIPTIGPKLLLGREGAEEFALADQEVLPGRLQELAHRFRYPTLEGALAHELGMEEPLGTHPEPEAPATRNSFVDAARDVATKTAAIAASFRKSSEPSE